MPYYRLTRNNIEYFVFFPINETEVKPDYFYVEVKENVNHGLKNLTPSDILNEKNEKVEGWVGYFSYVNNVQKNQLRDFLKPLNGDKLEFINDKKVLSDVTNNRVDFDTILGNYFEEKELSNDEVEVIVKKAVPKTKDTNLTPLIVEEDVKVISPLFSRPSSRTWRILAFVGLGLLTLAFITATILTAGAAAGIVGLAGTAGFVGVISSITGLSALSLSSIPAFMALASVAMGGFIASIFSFGSTLRMGTIHQGEDFHNAPKKLKEWFRKLTPRTKVILAVGFGLLALGLLALGGWAIASIVGILAVPAIVGPLLGGLATGFLGTLGGVTTLLGVGFASVTLSAVAMKAAYDFSKQAKEDRTVSVSNSNKAIEWDEHPVLPSNLSELKGYPGQIQNESNPPIWEANRSLFREIGDKLPALPFLYEKPHIL